MNQQQIAVGRYELGDQIGSGGMGTVYHATDSKTGETVAIKHLQSERATPEMIERFIREGEALRQLNHPNIVKMLDAVQEDGQHYLIMEMVSGGSLHEKLNETSQMPVKSVLEIALDLADALTRAHRLDIIHRDIKPANVLIAEDGTPRLTDFGLAYVQDSEITHSGMMLGTWAYMSPEALGGEEPSAKTDIWAFGVMIFQMLAGQRPFEGATPPAVVKAVTTRPPPDLETLCPDTPLALVDLVYRMLAKNPAERIPSVRLVGAELEAIIKGTPTPARFAPEIQVVVTDMAEAPQSATPHNLPSQPTHFIGRERELAAVKNLLQRENVRLVTLSGVGGTGKTRLSLQAAIELLDHFTDGVYFVEIATITEPDKVIPAVNSALKINEMPGDTPIDTLARFVKGRHILLVLDNFEQVISAALLIRDLLEATDLLRIMVSSREVLRIKGEHAYPVPPLGLPEDRRQRTAEVYAEYEAVRLFKERAQAANPAFELTEENAPTVAQICEKLDGLPLAIELAAARSRMFSPEQLLDRLSDRLKALTGGGRDLPARQQTLRGAIDWSYDLLNEDEKSLFAGLCVFAGGWSLEAAEHILSDTLGLDVIFTMESLLDKSLIIPTAGALDRPRYMMLETIREYALGRLEQREDTGVIRDAHLDYYCRWTEGGLEKMMEREGTQNVLDTWARALEEHDNIRACVYWGLENDSLESALSICGDMMTSWDRSPLAVEGIAWMEAGLSTKQEISPELHGKVLAKLAWSTRFLPGGQEKARQYAEQALAIFRELGDETKVAGILNTLGAIAVDSDETIKLWLEAIEIHKGQENRRGVAIVTGNMSGRYNNLGDHARALVLAQEAVDALTEPEEDGYRAMYTKSMAIAEMWLGNYERAHQLFEFPTRFWRGTGRTTYHAGVNNDLSILALLEGRHDDAFENFSESLEILKESPGIGSIFEALDGMGYHAAALENWERAVILLAAASQLRERFEEPRTNVYQGRFYDPYLAAIHAHLDEETFDMLWAKGAAMSLDTAIDYALEKHGFEDNQNTEGNS